MTPQLHERSISTTARFVLADANAQEFNVYRELVMHENTDGTWLVSALLPETAEADDSGEAIVSSSIKVTEGATLAFLFALLADPGSFEEHKTPMT